MSRLLRTCLPLALTNDTMQVSSLRDFRRRCIRSKKATLLVFRGYFKCRVPSWGINCCFTVPRPFTVSRVRLPPQWCNIGTPGAYRPISRPSLGYTHTPNKRVQRGYTLGHVIVRSFYSSRCWLCSCNGMFVRTHVYYSLSIIFT